MNELQVFSFNENQVRTMVINDEPYFVGKDVAEVLGYANTRKAILDHVENEDKKDGVTIRDAMGREQKPTLINESGLYSLILSSKLPQAKEFKRWVTSEVLPSIRKTGSYQVPTNPMQALELMFQVQKETNETVAEHSERLKDLEDNKLLSASEYNYISRAIRNKARETLELFENTNSRKVRSKIYSAINRDLNAFVGIKTRCQFKAKDFDRALEFIQNWQLSYTDKRIIEQLQLDI